jgi:hypothetical protein
VIVRAVKTCGELADYVMEAGRRGRLYSYRVNDEKTHREVEIIASDDKTIDTTQINKQVTARSTWSLEGSHPLPITAV